MSNVVFELFAKLGLDSSEYEEGLNGAKEKATSIGGTIANGLKVIGKAGVAVGAAVATATVAAGTALVKGAGDVAAYGDNIDKMSQKMGISAQAYQEWDAILQHSGTSIEALKPSMKTLATQAEKNSDAFQKLGISQEEVASLSQEDLFSRVISGLQGMEEGTERTYLTSQLLGRGATELGALLNTSAEDTELMRRRVHELGGVMSDEAVKAAAAYQDSLQDMQTGFSGLKRNLISDFLPSITTVMDGLTEIFTGNYDEGLNKISDGVDKVVTNLTRKVPEFFKIGGSIIEALAKAIIDNAPTILSAGVNLIMQLGESFIKELPRIAEIGLEFIKTLGNALISSLPTLIPAVIDIVLQIANMLIENAPQLINGAVALITGLATALIDNIPVLIPAIVQLVIGIATALIENLPILVQAIIDINIALVQAIIENFPLILDACVQILVAIVDLLAQYGLQFLEQVGVALSSIWDRAVEFGGEVASFIVNTFIDFVSKTNSGMRDMFNKVVEWLAQLPGKMAYYAGYAVASFLKFVMELPGKVNEIFTNVMNKLIAFGTNFVNKAIETAKKFLDSMVNGIKNLPTNLANIFTNVMTAVSTFASNLLNKATEAARGFVTNLVNGVSSLPDKFREIGSNIVQGIWNGISSGWQWLQDSVANLAQSLLQGAKDALGIASPSKKFAWVGRMVDEGFAKGLNDYSHLIDGALDDIIKLPSVDDLVGDISADVSVTRKANETGNNGYTQILNITSPVALTPYEVARQARNATRDMVLAMSM